MIRVARWSKKNIVAGKAKFGELVQGIRVEHEVREVTRCHEIKYRILGPCQMLGFNQSEMKSHWSILCRDVTWLDWHCNRSTGIFSWENKCRKGGGEQSGASWSWRPAEWQWVRLEVDKLSKHSNMIKFFQTIVVIMLQTDLL